MIGKIKGLIREPVVIFFISGFLLFFVYQKTTNHYDLENREIVVTQPQLDLLFETFEKTWSRAPSNEERQKLLESHIKNEVFYREAVSMGLDKSDQSIKRRLRQVMELLLDDYTNVYPSESQLQEFLSKNPEGLLTDPNISFQHRYYAYEEKDQAINDLTVLQYGDVPESITSRTMSMIPDTFDDAKKYEVMRIFGDLFADSVFTLEIGKWQGPVESAYGWHLVEISSVTPGEVPSLSEIWDDVEREWSVMKREQLLNEQYQRMKEKYHVVLEIEENDL